MSSHAPKAKMFIIRFHYHLPRSKAKEGKSSVWQRLDHLATVGSAFKAQQILPRGGGIGIRPLRLPYTSTPRLLF